MDLGCFHKYIAFYAYINCCKTNSSLKRGNEKVAISNINTIISNDIQKVWNIVLAVDKYNSWRSDLSKTEIINDKQFIEYTKNGYATTFTVTVAEPYKRWEFDMENSNMKGHWIGVFIDKGNETQIDFTENRIFFFCISDCAIDGSCGNIGYCTLRTNASSASATACGCS